MNAFQDHQVQFYEQGVFAAQGVADYLSAGLRQHQGLLVAARRAHWELIQRALSTHGHDIHSLLQAGQLIYVDAEEILATLLVDDRIAPQQFSLVVPPRIDHLQKKFRGVRVYGEIVDVLAERSQFAAMMALEELWHQLREERSFELLCGYSVRPFSHPDRTADFDRVCAIHGTLLPSSLDADGDRRSAKQGLLERQLQLLSQQLAQQNKWAALGEMSAGVAHELNNPLAVVITAVECLSARLSHDQESQHLVALAKRSTERITSIVQNIRLFTRESIPMFKPLSLTQSVLKVLTLQRPSFEAQGISLKFVVDESQHYQIKGEALALEQVLINLMNNARDALRETPPGAPRHVTLTLSQAGTQEVRIVVEDNGPGMSEDIRAKIFTPFFTTKDASSGTGLGLSMSFGIIRQHNGTIRCESERGLGTRFIITLPAEINL